MHYGHGAIQSPREHLPVGNTKWEINDATGPKYLLVTLVKPIVVTKVLLLVGSTGAPWSFFEVGCLENRLWKPTLVINFVVFCFLVTPGKTTFHRKKLPPTMAPQHAHTNGCKVIRSKNDFGAKLNRKSYRRDGGFIHSTFITIIV